MKHGKRDANESEIVSALEAIGCSVLVMHVPCDLLVGWRGRTMLLEVKTEAGAKRKNGGHTSDQVIFKAEWRGHYAVVQSVDEAIASVQKETLR